MNGTQSIFRTLGCSRLFGVAGFALVAGALWPTGLSAQQTGTIRTDAGSATIREDFVIPPPFATTVIYSEACAQDFAKYGFQQFVTAVPMHFYLEKTDTIANASTQYVVDINGHVTTTSAPNSLGQYETVLRTWLQYETGYDQSSNLVTPMQEVQVRTSTVFPYWVPLSISSELSGAEYTTQMLLDRVTSAPFVFSDNIKNATTEDKYALRRLDPSEGFIDITKLKYQIKVLPGYTGTVTWMEIFVPDDASLPVDVINMSAEIGAGATQTVIYTIDPLGVDPADGNVARRHPLVNGTYHVVLPDIAVDANRDGLIQTGVASPDHTPATAPFRFWLNDDIDRGHTVDDTDYEQDDIGATEAAANSWVEDWKYNTVQSKRDLEDFSRIVISTSGLSDAFKNGDLYLGLKWTDTVGTPSIKLFPQGDSSGGLSYLTDDNQAAFQLTQIAILNQRYPNDDVFAMSSHTVVTPGDLFVLPQSLWNGASGDTLKRSLLFEGCSAGTGQLRLVILKKDGTDYTEIGEGPGVWFDLKKIGDMYEHWSVGDSNGGAPNPVAGRIASLSGSGSAFSYTASSPEDPEYILYVHGWNMEQWEKERYAETAYKRLWWQGYKGRFGLFSWPTTNGFTTKFDAAVNSTNFDQGEFSAWRSAAPLRQLLQTLNTAYGGQLYVLSHSMGGIVTSEALRLQSDANGAPIVQVYVASQAAVSAHVYDGTLSDATGSPNALQWTYAYPGTGVSLNYGPQTPNIYKNWTAFVLKGSAVSSSAVNRLVNFYNENDYALSAPVWQFNQLTKPDFADYPELLWEYYYVGDFTGVPASDGFRKVGKYTNLSGEVILNLGNRTAVQDRYEIMSFGAESRVKAFGATPNVGQGISNAVDLQTIWPADADNHSAHKWHSAEFRSTIQLERNYWKTLLSDRGFDISTVTLP